MQDKLDRIEQITKDMEVPVYKRQDVKWLLKNVSVRNSRHPQYNDLVVLLKDVAQTQCKRVLRQSVLADVA